MPVPSPAIAVMDTPWLEPRIGAAKSVTGDEHHSANPGRSRRAARFADAFDRKRRLLGGARLRFEFGDGRQIGIDQFEIGKFVCQQIGVGEARKFVLGRRARHGHGPCGKRGGAIIRNVIGGDHRLAAADQHAQAKIVAFGAFGLFNLAVA